MDLMDPDKTTIAVLSDFHVSEPDHPDADDRIRRLLQVIEAIRASKPDLVLSPGDLTEHGEAGELQTSLECLQRLETTVRLVPGNHDVGDKIIEGRLGVTAKRIELYRGIMGADAYSEQVKGIHLIGLNGPLIGSGLPEEELQWRLLESALATRGADTLRCPPCIVMLHYPPYIETPEESAGGYWALEAAPRRRLLDVAAAGRVSVVLSGHLHRPLWTSYRGVALATAPSVAFGLPFGVQPTGWMTLTISNDGQVGRTLHYAETEPSA